MQSGQKHLRRGGEVFSFRQTASSRRTTSKLIGHFSRFHYCNKWKIKSQIAGKKFTCPKGQEAAWKGFWEPSAAQNNPPTRHVRTKEKKTQLCKASGHHRCAPQVKLPPKLCGKYASQAKLPKSLQGRCASQVKPPSNLHGKYASQVKPPSSLQGRCAPQVKPSNLHGKYASKGPHPLRHAGFLLLLFLLGNNCACTDLHGACAIFWRIHEREALQPQQRDRNEVENKWTLSKQLEGAQARAPPTKLLGHGRKGGAMLKAHIEERQDSAGKS
eukprot:1145459-Pelagomonas_calceolata.AAC.2